MLRQKFHIPVRTWNFSRRLNTCAGDQNKALSVLGEALGRPKKYLIDGIFVEEIKITDCKSIADNCNSFF